MLIFRAGAIVPATRPPVGSGPPLEVGDIWINQLGARQRYDGTSWAAFVPQVFFSNTQPAAAQVGDLWVHPTTGAQSRRVADGWETDDPPAGIVPRGAGLVDREKHIAKAGSDPFEVDLVDPAAGIVFLYRRTTAADEWVIKHDMRSRWVAVTVVDDTRTPPVTMMPDIEYDNNTCTLHFARAVSGYAVIHASKPAIDQTV